MNIDLVNKILWIGLFYILAYEFNNPISMVFGSFALGSAIIDIKYILYDLK